MGGRLLQIMWGGEESRRSFVNVTCVLFAARVATILSVICVSYMWTSLRSLPGVTPLQWLNWGNSIAWGGIGNNIHAPRRVLTYAYRTHSACQSQPNFCLKFYKLFFSCLEEIEIEKK